jgi:hypothetical protein
MTAWDGAAARWPTCSGHGANATTVTQAVRPRRHCAFVESIAAPLGASNVWALASRHTDAVAPVDARAYSLVGRAGGCSASGLERLSACSPDGDHLATPAVESGAMIRVMNHHMAWTYLMLARRPNEQRYRRESERDLFLRLAREQRRDRRAWRDRVRLNEGRRRSG